jgi:anti-anti-sigma factor
MKGEWMEYRDEADRLILIPGTDLVASRIEALRDFFDETLQRHPDAPQVVLDVAGVHIVDSLGVNLIVGLFRQTAADGRSMALVGANPDFMKVANFFRLPTLFSIEPEAAEAEAGNAGGA